MFSSLFSSPFSSEGQHDSQAQQVWCVFQASRDTLEQSPAEMGVAKGPDTHLSLLESQWLWDHTHFRVKCGEFEAWTGVRRLRGESRGDDEVFDWVSGSMGCGKRRKQTR